ncbi:MAG: hypothetical protein J7L38_01600 [Thermoproteales archaeon]|nr:hypothetical protein [Thermoproteales archaeon]
MSKKGKSVMGLLVTDAYSAFVVKARSFVERASVLDFYSYSAVNILSAVNIFSPCIEIRGGKMKLRATDDVHVAITGWGNIVINGVQKKVWKVFHLTRGHEIELVAKPYSILYLNLVGGMKLSDVKSSGKIRGECEILPSSKYSFEETDRVKRALTIPESYIPDLNGDRKLVKVISEENVRISGEATVVGKAFEREYILKRESLLEEITPTEYSQGGAGSLLIKDKGHLSVPLVHVNEEMPLLGRLSPPSLDLLARVPERDRISIMFTGTQAEEWEVYNYIKKIMKLQKIIKAAKEAAQRGAKLLKLKINGKIFDAWIEELE